MIDVNLERLRARGAARGRSCGPCTACCTVMAVVELRKPMRRACDHVGRDGCQIHAERPGSCREFNCLWLRGALSEGIDARPDQLGVFFDYFEELGTHAPRMIAFELWPGAFDSPEARAWLRSFARTHTVEISTRDGAWGTLRDAEE